MENKINYMHISFYKKETETQNKGCLNCRRNCNLRYERVDGYFDLKECKQWQPAMDFYVIDIFSEEERDKILQFIKDNHYGEV